MDRSPAGARRPNVLVVDDDRGSAELIKMMLETRGYDVVTTYSGNDAIALIEETMRQTSAWQPIPIDVIMLDIMMPGADGFKVCQWVKDDPLLRYVPVIMVTALNSASDKVAAVEFGADGYIAKPFLPEELSVAAKAKVQIKRREEALLRQNRELKAICAVSDAAMGTLDPKRVLSEGLAALLAHTDISAAAIYCYDETGERLELAAECGVERPKVLPAHQGLLGQIARTQSPVLRADLPAEASAILDDPGSTRLKSYIGIPLRGIERSLGVLELYHRQPFGFREPDIDLYLALGDRIGVALQNAEIFERTQALLMRSSALATGAPDVG